MYYLGAVTSRRAGLLPTLLAAVALWPLAGAGCAEAEETEARIPPSAVEAARAEGRLLLDVRTREEFATGHVPGAALIPLAELPARMDELAARRGDGVVVYCESGGRAARAAALLREAGFGDVVLLEGSMRRWRSEGLPVATP